MAACHLMSGSDILLRQDMYFDRQSLTIYIYIYIYIFQTCTTNDSCAGYTYSGYTGQCQVFNINYTPPSVPDMYQDYYMVVSSAVKVCDPGMYTSQNTLIN